MTRGKRLALLLLALVVLALAAFAATRLNRDGEEAEAETMVVYALDESALETLAWTYQGETMSFDYADGTWTYNGDEAFPVNTSLMDQMLYNLQQVTAVTSITDPGDLSVYGLEDPAVSVSVNGEKVLDISEASNLDGNRYLADAAGNVYLGSSGLLDTFTYGLYDLVRMESVPTLSDVTAFSLQTEEGTRAYTCQPADEEDEDAGDTWLLEGESQDTEQVTSLISAVTGVTWNSCVSYSATEEELDAYGLTEPAVRASVRGTAEDEEQTFTLELGGLTEDGTGCYARIAGSAMVYTVDASVLETLLAA